MAIHKLERHAKMTVFQLTLLTAINMMGSGIVMLPTKLAEVGTISILSWFITATGSICLAYAFAKCGRFSRKPGMGGYSEYAFGKSGNFLANYTYGLSLLFANIAIAITCVGYAEQLLSTQFHPFFVCLATIGILWACTTANFKGAYFTGRISEWCVWAVVAPIVGLSLIGWYWFSPELYFESWNPNHVPFFTAVKASISMTLWAFLGLESACANSEAVENPEKNVPIAVLWSTIGVAIVYILSTNIIAGIVPNADLLKSTAPFGLVFTLMFNSTVGKIVTLLLVISCFGSTLGWQFTIAKVFQLAARDGFFPKVFSRVNKFGAPVAGMIIITAVQSLFGFMTVSPKLFDQFNVLVDLAVVTNIMPYLLSMAAVAVIMKKAKVPIKEVKLYTAIGFIGAVYSFYALASAGTLEVFWGSIVTFFGWTLWGFIATKFSPAQDQAL